MTRTPEITNVARRSVLLGLAAGSFVLSIRLPAQAQEKKFGGEGMPGGVKDDPKLFLSVAEDGTVNLLCIRAEMGQGIRTGFQTVIADELGADLGRVKVLQAPGNQAKFGNQDTDGSRSMRHHFLPLRRIAAATRQMLAEEAAAKWGVPVTEVKADNHGMVHGPSNRRLEFGALAKGAAARPVPPADKLVLKPVSEFRYIGKDVPLIDNFDFTTGKAVYGIDARVDGMAYAVVARPPVLGGKVKSFDAAKAMKVPGVLKVITIDPPTPPIVFQPLGGVAVIAENTFAAIKGRSQLEIQWDDGPNASYDSVQYRKTLEEAAAKPGKVVRDNGDVDKALAGAAKRLSAEYYVPHLAQAPMEPPSAPRA
jgi:isoquinoline 1-oxidoreductase beta subunit